MRGRFFRFAFLLAWASLLSAQSQQYIESLEIRLHNLDAVVTDREGRPVKGLSREDFVILENGVPQEITNFSFYESSASTSSLPGAVDAPAPPPETIAPARHYVFFIDEMAIQYSARKKLKDSASLIVRSMRPGDAASIVRPSGAAKIVQDYTGDMSVVERTLGKAIDDCKLRLTAPALREFQMFRRALETASTPNERIAAKRLYAEGTQARVEQRLGQIRALVTSMAGLDGKKILVLITSGLSAQPGREAYSFDEQVGLTEAPKPAEGVPDAGAVESMGPMARLNLDIEEFRRSRTAPSWKGMHRISATDLRPQIDSIARTAAAEGVIIYALEPEVPLQLNFSRGAESPPDPNQPGTSVPVVPPEMFNQLLTYQGETLTSMTEKTGGKWFRGIGAIDDTFRQVTQDLEVYYSLAYRARGDDAVAPRKVKVVVKDRPELQVRTRTEVIHRSAARDMSDRVLAELVHPRGVDDLKMTVKADSPKRKGRAYEIPVEIVIPMDRITFVHSSDGRYRARVAVHYAAAREGREFVTHGRRDQLIELTGRQYAEMGKIRYRYASSILVPKGKLRIAFGVLDAGSRDASLQTLSVEAR